MGVALVIAMQTCVLSGLCLVLLSQMQCIHAKSVTALSDSDFTTKTSNGQWLVKFYAPWCSACKKLQPTYAQLPDLLPGVNVAEVDIDQSKELASKFGVNSIPKVKFIFNSGKSVVPYTGSGTLDDLKEFVAKHQQKQNSAGTNMLGIPLPDPDDTSVRAKLTRMIQSNPLITVSAAFALGTVLGALAGATIALKEKEAMPNTPTWMARPSPGISPAAGEGAHPHNY